MYSTFIQEWEYNYMDILNTCYRITDQKVGKRKQNDNLFYKKRREEKTPDRNDTVLMLIL